MIFDPTITINGTISAVSFLFSVGAVVYAWIATRRTNVEERFKAGSDRMDRHETRINSLEQSVKALPTKEDMHQIELGLARLNGAMGRMEAVLEGNQKIMGRLETVVVRHEDHLLNK